MIIGRTAGAKRFRSEACFARHCGTAPIPASSGKTIRHRLHRGGDRQLNRAIHIIALGRMAGDPETRAYIERRVSEGKTKLEAHPLPQTPHRQTDLAPPLQHPAHHPGPDPATTRTRHSQRSRTNAMHEVKTRK